MVQLFCLSGNSVSFIAIYKEFEESRDSGNIAAVKSSDIVSKESWHSLENVSEGTLMKILSLKEGARAGSQKKLEARS